jgi:hypothetical protein
MRTALLATSLHNLRKVARFEKAVGI